jgi:hypothetical protein
MQPLRSPAERNTGQFEFRTDAAIDRPILAPRQDARAIHARAQLWVAGQALDAQAAQQEKWSLRRRLAIIIGGSLALWSGLAYAGWLLLSSI